MIHEYILQDYEFSSKQFTEYVHNEYMPNLGDEEERAGLRKALNAFLEELKPPPPIPDDVLREAWEQYNERPPDADYVHQEFVAVPRELLPKVYEIIDDHESTKVK